MKNQMRIAALALLMFAIVVVDAALINIVNQCSQTISACQVDQTSAVSCYGLSGGQSKQINVGATWTGGLVWGYPGNPSPATGLAAKPQADLAEFTIGANGQDFYDISVVNAYNLGLKIIPTGTSCPSPSCSISNLNSFCQSPNTLTGPPGDGCYNTDGPGNVPTPGTIAFDNVCPQAITYSTDTTKVFSCATGTNYEVDFSCP